tara:strand:+ start:2258 stop:2659 length:402 start_codon:yes stop_codon:yes gene_type:complete
MGDRFYFQQLSKRKRKVAWDDERKAQAVEMYEAESPTPETSMEIVKAIADEMSESPNGVRMILTKAGVYVKKTPATGSAKNGGSSGNTRVRVSKAAAQETLITAITDAGKEVDEEIISKLTGKAAVYFTGLLS